MKPKEKSTLWLGITTALISLIGLNEATAQETIKTEQTEDRSSGKFIVTPVKEEVEISGIVNNENKLPFPGVNIVIKGTQIGIQTGSDGKYNIKVHKGATLIISYTGYTDTYFKIDNLKNIDLFMDIDDYVTLGAVVCTIKKRTFFGCIFHSIRNLV